MEPEGGQYVSLTPNAIARRPGTEIGYSAPARHRPQPARIDRFAPMPPPPSPQPKSRQEPISWLFVHSLDHATDLSTLPVAEGTMSTLSADLGSQSAVFGAPGAKIRDRGYARSWK